MMMRFFVFCCILLIYGVIAGTTNRSDVDEDDVPDEEAQLEQLKRADRGEPAEGRSRRKGGDSSTVYTRWGRNVCQDEAELVYSGIAGGGFYNHQGSGSNLVCLTREPEWGNYTAALEGHARIYGAEYESPKAIFNTENAPVKKVNGLHDQDVPCAVCRVRHRSSMIMIPGRKSCAGEDWTREYWGYLATGHYNHKNQIQYVCVDSAPEGDPKGIKNDNGALLYLVQGVCGSLPCPPYVQGRELTCVVCTK